ncbi:MAG: response regulator [Candidatus Taylorbacteria bacterium CG11_big_fil_rev_8_21_14_0_20_46_11]|uniref:Response regulator n=1 Tax=Candidatus Taylorbacteria bacterium CG11_big_fil_rev_8_21_14_0_20_46_11 TaxID=1975025 RepID=A0A2H0KAI3_9BACT|nr:MAG: response regulator [Candidatus Taylorbacteria bacterium CG11_big_fil_rev_8_21_14_0_20_46_11]
MTTESSEKKQMVLLVDDDQFLLNMYTLKFKTSGFDVEVGNNATAGLQKLRDGLIPDIILCDLVMPGMDGLELIKHIKEEKLTPSSKIVVLTNQGQTTDIEKAQSLGVDGYIVKASTIPSEVVEEVRKILSKKK